MKTIYSNYTASITELKKSPTALLEQAKSEPIAILNHNRPTAYLIPAETYEKMMEIIDDYLLAQEVKKRLNEEFEPVKVALDEL